VQELTFAKRLYKHEVRGWQDAALAVRGDNSRAAATRAALATFFFIMSLELGVE